jgi:hypothetical protein
MGMDVYGNKPKSTKGEYFRASVWSWHPIWDYCLDLHPSIASKVEYGHSNDGDGLKSLDAKTLGKLVLKDIESGVALDYINERKKALDSLPLIDCVYCDETGHRTWLDSSGLETKKICNSCNGERKVKQFATNYSLHIDHLKEFAEFMIDSGGFKIW